jgi:hypothetical protein
LMFFITDILTKLTISTALSQKPVAKLVKLIKLLGGAHSLEFHYRK